MPLLYTEHSLDFDGTNDFIEYGSVYAFERTDAFSGSLWIKTTGTGDYGLIGSFEDESPFRGWSLSMIDGYFRFELSNTAEGTNHLSVDTIATFNDGEWHHVAYTYAGDSSAANTKIYVDSEDQNLSIISDTLSSTIIGTAPFRIGARAGGAIPFDGRLTEVSVYDKELSAMEVTTIYNAGNTDDLLSIGPFGDIVGYWRLGEHNYPTVPDLSPSGNDGTMTNMAADEIVIDAPRSHEAFYSFLLDRVNEYVNVGNVDALSFERTDAFSFSIWFKMATAGGGYLFSKENDSGAFTGYSALCTSSGSILLRVGYGTVVGQAAEVETQNTFADGEWHHLIWAYDGSNVTAGITVIIDGVVQMVDINSDDLATSILNTSSFSIGSRNGTGAFFRGNLNELSAWSKELTLSEAQDLYNGGRPRDARTLGINSFLRGYWTLGNRSTFPTVLDLSPLGNDGTAFNMEVSDIKLDASNINFDLPSVSINSLVFEGASNPGWVNLGGLSELSFDIGDSFSISTFFKKSISASGSIISKRLTDPLNEGWTLNISNRVNFFCSSTDGTYQLNIISDKIHIDDIWHHAVITVSELGPASGIRIYVDGVSVPTSTTRDDLTTGTILTPAPVMIGRNSEPVSANYFDGYIDNIIVYNRVLTEVEVRTLYGARSPTDALERLPLANLVGLWSLDGYNILPRHSMGPPYPLTTTHNPVALYLFDGDSSDSSANSFADIPSASSAVYASRPLMDVADVAAGDYFIYESPIPELVILGDLTIEVTAYFSSYAANRVLVRIAGPAVDTSIENLAYGIYVQSTGALQYIAERGSGIDISYTTATGVFPLNSWNHVVMVRASNVIRFYVNGRLVGTSGVLNAPTDGANGLLSIGGTSAFSGTINGQIANVKIISSALSEFEILEETALSLNVPLVLDSSGNESHGLPNATVATSYVPDVPAPLESEWFLEFDRIDDFVAIGNVSTLSFERTIPFTIMCWVWINSAEIDGINIFSKNAGPSSYRGWSLFTRSTGVLAFSITNNTETNEVYVYGTTSLRTGSWHNVAVTFDGSSSAQGVRLFVDGVEETKTVSVDNLNATTITAAGAAIGNINTAIVDSPMWGFIDDTAVYNRVLSPSEILFLGGQATPLDHAAVGPIDSLIGWWRMGDPGPSTYPTIPDLAPLTNNPGTMTNMSLEDIVNSISLIEFYKMRATQDGYFTTWISNESDFDGIYAPEVIVPGSVVKIIKWDLNVKVYKMRGLQSIGPPIVWLSGINPDWDATIPSETIIPGTVIILAVLPFDINVPTP